MKQNTVLSILTGAVFLITLSLLYLLLAPLGRSIHSPVWWMAFGSIAVLLVVGVFAPMLARRLRGASAPTPLTSADIRFTIALIAVVCPLAFWARGAYGSLVILLVPIAFLIRQQIKVAPHDTNL